VLRLGESAEQDEASGVRAAGLEDRERGSIAPNAPFAGDTRRAAAAGGITVAMLVAAGIGIPDSGQVVPNGSAPTGSVSGPPGSTAVRSAIDASDDRRQEQDPMKTPGVRAAIVAGVVMVASNAGAQQLPAVQWPVADGGNGHWYAIKTWNQKTPWATANSYAQSIGGHLATITSLNEDTWTTQLTMGWPGAWFGLSGPWIGATATCVCLDGNACFSWVTGEPFEYARWHPGNPDNVTYTGAEGPVGVLLWEPNWTRGWQDASLGNEAWYGDVRSAMIEWSADCNSDGIVDYGQILAGDLADTDSNGIPDVCEVPSCIDADLNPSGIVDGADLGAMLAFWGPVSPAFPRADINGDGNVNGADLGILLSLWGPCGG
jgi:hypothetical protein